MGNASNAPLRFAAPIGASFSSTLQNVTCKLLIPFAATQVTFWLYGPGGRLVWAQGGAGFSLPTRFPASRAGRKAGCRQDCPPHTNGTTPAGAVLFFGFGSGPRVGWRPH